MKIAFLNDTVSWYHWGCTGTSMGIRSQLTKLGCDVSYVPIQLTSSFDNVPKQPGDFGSAVFFEHARKNNQLLFDRIAEADLVIINGEGTIHHLTPPCLTLLYVAYAAGQYLKKPVQIINHSPYPLANKARQKMTNLSYTGVYEGLDFIGIREHISKASMDELGIRSELTFDCLPLSLESRGLLLPTTTKQNYIVLANSVSFPFERMPDLVNTLATLSKTGIGLRVLIGAKSHPATDELTFLEWLEPYRNELEWEVVKPLNLEEWYKCIANARLLISGRFHHSIAAWFQNTPFVLMASNTPKNIALTESFRVDAPVGYDEDNFSDALLLLARDRLDNTAKIRTDNQLAGLLIERAKLNFAGVRKRLGV